MSLHSKSHRLLQSRQLVNSSAIVREKFSKLAIGAGLVVITWAVFAQTFGHQFINYDDPLYVLENEHVRSGLSGRSIAWAFKNVHSQNWHPLTTISHMLDCQLFGVNPGAHHLINVFLHSAAAVLLFVLLQDRTGRLWASGFVAAVFAIHPLRVESVAWIAERKDVLSGMFFMLTLLSYGRWTRQQTLGRYLTLSILFACGLMSKPMLVTTPFVLLLLDYWPLDRVQRTENKRQRTPAKRTIGQLLVEKIPLFGLSAGSCFATLWAQNFALGSTESLPLKWRFLNAILAYFEYIRQMFWPANLIPFYIHPENRIEIWRLIVAAIVLIGVTWITFERRRQNPYLIVGWLWYLIMLVPVIGIVQVGLQAHADRYTYLPQIGLYVGAVWLICERIKPAEREKIILGTVAAIVLAVLSILSWKQTTYWRDSETIWRHTLTVTPESDVAHAGLAGILAVRGQVDDAIGHYEHALRLRDGNSGAHYGLGKALAMKQKTDAAIFHFQRALEIQPDYLAASNDLGALFASKGEIKNALAAWRQTRAFDPDNLEALNNIAWVLSTATDSELRDANEARRLAERAVQTSGQSPVLLRTLAAAEAENRQFDEAIRTAEEARKIAQKYGDQELAANLERCIESFRREEPLRTTQVSH